MHCSGQFQTPNDLKNELTPSSYFGDEIDLKEGNREKLRHAIETCAAQIKACTIGSLTESFEVCLHSPGSKEHYDRISQGCRPHQFTWNRHCQQSNHSRIFVIAAEEADSTPYWEYCGCKILMGIEPLGWAPHIKNMMELYYDQASIILAAFEPDNDPDGKFIPFTYGSTFISDSERKVYPKTKNISIIASAKRRAQGHQLRHTLIENYAEDWGIDLYGRGYNPVDRKVEALQEYRYSVIIENSQGDYYYISEKLIDAFLTGTIPIYWGSKAALELFNANGILFFNDESEFEAALMMATPDFYRKQRAAISENYELALKFCCPEDRLYNNVFGPLLAAIMNMRPSSMAVKASATKAAPAAIKTTKALNITKSNLVGSQGGKATRNVDGIVYTINYDADKDTVIIKDLVNRYVYDAEVGEKDNRISLIWESATPLAGPPNFQQLQMVLKADGPGPEIINGRVAMAAFLGISIVELISGQTAVSTLATPAGTIAAVTLALLTTAATIAPAFTGKVSIDKALPNPNYSYPDQQLPYYFSPLAESINGRVAMIGVAALLINEAIRGVPVF